MKEYIYHIVKWQIHPFISKCGGLRFNCITQRFKGTSLVFVDLHGILGDVKRGV